MVCHQKQDWKDFEINEVNLHLLRLIFCSHQKLNLDFQFKSHQQDNVIQSKYFK
jgi:hypothetical protein